jgi:DNA-binding NtrC family response regulator
VYKPPANEYQRAVEKFKRELLALTLAAHGGNRSRASRALGLQRTYLVRLIRDFGLGRPAAEASRRDAEASGRSVRA